MIRCNFTFHLLIYCLHLLQGNLNEIQHIERLLVQTAKSYPNITIRAAVAEKHNLRLNIPHVFIDVIDMKEKRMGHHKSLLGRKDGFVWQRLIEHVNTAYTFVAIDLLYMDSKDLNLIRMVNI